jgi:hypothetical protein
MTPDRLKDLLGEIPTPQATRAREQAVAEARAEIAARGESDGAAARPSREWRPRVLSIAAAAVLVVVVLLTPPGRAASAWVGELVGIGDVGGPPTQEKRGRFEKASTAVVIDNGVGPDGSRYEWVAYECKVEAEEGIGTQFEGIGVSLDWPGVQDHEGGGSCEELQGRPRSGVFSQHGVHVLPSQMKGVAEPDLVISGVTGPDVHRVSVIYTDGEGIERELPVDFARVEGKLREVASRPEALGTFVAFLPGETAARDEIESRLDLRARFGTGKLKLGPIGRREREQARKAFEACPATSQGPSPADDCLAGRLPPGPFEYVAYDERGQVLGRLTEPLTAASVRPVSTIEAEGREEPGDKRAKRIPETGSSAAVVLMTGRSPDDALYEVYVEQSDHGNGIGIFWPYAPFAGVGFYGDDLPPSTAFGRRNPERVFAKPFGFLNDASEATTHRVLSGFARTNVSRVQVVYLDGDESRHDAPVKLVQATAAVLEKLESSEPFGYWVAFVPRSAGHRPIEVTAYGENGDRLGGPFTLRNP